jgi:hypothetical protein
MNGRPYDVDASTGLTFAEAIAGASASAEN